MKLVNFTLNLHSKIALKIFKKQKKVRLVNISNWKLDIPKLKMTEVQKCFILISYKFDMNFNRLHRTKSFVAHLQTGTLIAWVQWVQLHQLIFEKDWLCSNRSWERFIVNPLIFKQVPLSHISVVGSKPLSHVWVRVSNVASAFRAVWA